MLRSAVRSLVVLLCAIGLLAGAGLGFKSRQLLAAYFARHGHEIGAITVDECLRFAQHLRDAPVGESVLEAMREDRVITRFEKDRGWFVAVNAGGAIRTFFIPVEGEWHFRRQARRPK